MTIKASGGGSVKLWNEGHWTRRDSHPLFERFFFAGVVAYERLIHVVATAPLL